MLSSRNDNVYKCQNIIKIMEKPRVFLDYGGLIMNYDFNSNTLLRAHNLALKQIMSEKSLW